MPFPLAVVSVLLLFASSAAFAQSAAGQADVIGVERDRLIQPLARFDGRAWAAVSGAPAAWPREWTRWSEAGTATRVVAGVRRAAPTCVAPRTLAVESSGTASGAKTAYAGLVTSGRLDVRRLSRRTAGSRPWTSAVAAVEPLFERRAVENGLSKAVLAPLKATLDTMVASGDPASPVYYFEASKRVPDDGKTPEGEPKGIVRLSISGWLRTEGERLVPAGTRSQLHWDSAEPREQRPVADLVPVGVVRQSNGDVWLMRAMAEPGQPFVLYAVLRSSVRRLVSVEAAGC